MTDNFTTAPIPIRASAGAGDFARADVVVEGIEQDGPSFTGHVFLNNPAADQATPRTAANGYAGAFHVYGYGTPAGAPTDEVRAPITKSVMATERVRAALVEGDALTVTVVAVGHFGDGLEPVRPARVEIVLTARGEAAGGRP